MSLNWHYILCASLNKSKSPFSVNSPPPYEAPPSERSLNSITLCLFLLFSSVLGLKNSVHYNVHGNTLHDWLKAEDSPVI